MHLFSRDEVHVFPPKREISKFNREFDSPLVPEIQEIADRVQQGFGFQNHIKPIKFHPIKHQEHHFDPKPIIHEPIIYHEPLGYREPVKLLDPVKGYQKPEVHKPVEYHEPQYHPPEIHDPQYHQPEVHKPQYHQPEVHLPQYHEPEHYQAEEYTISQNIPFSYGSSGRGNEENTNTF